MNYLSGAFRYVAGGETEPHNVVPRLIDRIKTSALPHDRRSAIVALTDAAKESPGRQVQVGELGLKVIYAVLEQDVEYDDTIKVALGLLIAICGTLDPPAQPSNPANTESAIAPSEVLSGPEFEQASSRAASTNIDVFLGMPNALHLLLQLLDKEDFYVKFGTIELLTAMAANSRITLQSAMLEATQGVTRVCDLLDDTHRHVRSNAVLLLSTLCEQSPEICKIVAFGGVLEKLFSLLESVASDSSVAEYSADDLDDEDSLEAAIVVQDVLCVVRNLIQGTNTAKTFMRDTGCLPRLVAVLHRSTSSANISVDVTNKRSPLALSTGVKNAVEKQARKNLIVAMECIIGLVRETDNESFLVKNHLATTPLFRILSGIAFMASSSNESEGKFLENLLHIRIGALKAIAMLVRGHKDFRSMFTSSAYTVSVGDESENNQVAAMRTMCRDPSAAVRLSSYCALRESFVVDAGLDLPSSALLNAMAGSSGSGSYSIASGNRNVSRNSLSSAGDLASPSTSMAFIAQSLKELLVGSGPSSEAAIFYAASLVSWIADKAQGARERLLGSYINGGSLLPLMIRMAGKLEREKGPPVPRIALFSLVCVWLHENPSAVSAFLSSAMHLPMLVDILKGNGSRGDVAEVHIRGLAAVILGICLQATDNATDSPGDSDFLTGGGGASTVISRGTIADVIRSRIGVTAFIAALDDLRATKAFTVVYDMPSSWKLAETLVLQEERGGVLSAGGSLGHTHWYNEGLVVVVSEVYKSVSSRALDLVSEPNKSIGTGTGTDSTVTMNGHLTDEHGIEEERFALADSARDEMLNSYKEFIRAQDENLRAARRQIDELSAALREAQVELDSKSSISNSGRSPDTISALRREKDDLLAEKGALEALLEEKTVDFSALSDAFAALEAEHISGDTEPSDKFDMLAVELQEAQAQYSSLQQSYDAEMQKTLKLNNDAIHLENSVKMKEMEIKALISERDSLRRGVKPDVVDALQWKTRAELVESQMQSKHSEIENMQGSLTSFEKQVSAVQRARDEALTSVNSLKQQLQSTTEELESLRATRKRELQVSRESSAAHNSGAQNEIRELEHHLAEAKQALLMEKEKSAAKPSPEAIQGFEQLQSEHQIMRNAFEQMKTELQDTKEAVSQWQDRTQTSEEEKSFHADEAKRLGAQTLKLEGEVKKLASALVAEKQTAEDATSRASELEQQCLESDAIRRQTEEDARVVREQLASRTEQSIRLSGQLYEMEESKSRAEDELQTLTETLESVKTELEHAQGHTDESPGAADRASSAEEGMEVELAALKKELKTAQDAAAERNDLLNSEHAHAEMLGELEKQIHDLQRKLSESFAERSKLESELSAANEKILLLDEAEEAKRSLTMQVVSLQKTLSGFSRSSSDGSEVPHNNASEIKKLEDSLIELKTLVDEKDLRLNGLESSLTMSLEKSSMLDREIVDLRKQVAESETMLSVFQTERDELSQECDKLKTLVGRGPSGPIENETNLVEDLNRKLEAADAKGTKASLELAALVEACKLAQKPVDELKSTKAVMEDMLNKNENRIELLQVAIDQTSLSHDVEQTVKLIIHEASLTAQPSFCSEACAELASERNAILALKSDLVVRMGVLQSELDNMREVTKERDAALDRYNTTSKKLQQVSEKLSALEGVEEERSRLRGELNAAITDIETLRSQKASMEAALKHAESRALLSTSTAVTVPEVYTELSSQSASQKRVLELEFALRDAAKTVSATNHELIGAQALLVELSSDKTAMRAELSAAQAKIVKLTHGVEASRAPGQDAQMSEISEQDQGMLEETNAMNLNDRNAEVITGALNVARAEADNLRLALSRSTEEAEAAVNLVDSIQIRVEDIELKLQESRDSFRSQRATEELLRKEISDLESTLEEQSRDLAQQILIHETQIEKQELDFVEKLRINNERMDASESNAREKYRELSCTLEKTKDDLRDSAANCRNLEGELESSTSTVKCLSSKIDELERTKLQMSGSMHELQGELSRLQTLLNDTEIRERALASSLTKSEANIETSKREHAHQLLAKAEEHRSELEELEAEIERSNENIENAERSFQKAQKSLKEDVENLREEKRQQEEELASQRAALGEASKSLQNVTEEKVRTQNRLDDVIQKDAKELATVGRHLKEVQALLDAKTTEGDKLQEVVADLTNGLEKATKDLGEEREARAMLETKNRDYVVMVGTLELVSERNRKDLDCSKEELKDAMERIQVLVTAVERKESKISDLEKDIEAMAEDIKGLKTAKAKLEDSNDGLRATLDNVEGMKDSLEQDNEDLREWVGDLEKRATVLQSAAEDFEEVEQSLRETLESQRFATEQNSELVEELRHEKEEALQMRAAIHEITREKERIESSRDSAQRHIQELERRIREIREEHLKKVSNSEDAIRQKATLCAELETALAAAERRVAELVSTSDDLFDMSAEMKQRNEDLKRMRVRVEDAETKNEKLTEELQQARNEVNAIRETGSGDAYRTLEAEHNELLIYLADLELDVTTLREDLGRE